MEAEGWSTALRALPKLRKLTIVGLYADADGRLQDAADALPPSDRALAVCGEESGTPCLNLEELKVGDMGLSGLVMGSCTALRKSVVQASQETDPRGRAWSVAQLLGSMDAQRSRSRGV